MNWLTELKNTALDFFKTPFGERLVFGDSTPPTSQPSTTGNTAAAQTDLPGWVVPTAIGGGVLLVGFLVWALVRGK